METFWTLFSALLLAGSWLISIGMLFVVPVNRKPSSATAGCCSLCWCPISAS
jgi:hypothetical protein